MKFQILCFLFITILFSSSRQQKNNTTKEPSPPNIVIIFADDLGYGDLSCYGQKTYATPHLDKMAEQGVRFTNFYVSQPVCSASRASLLTGCYANRVGVSGAFMPDNNRGLHPQETTLGELVKQKGYATAIYGKWHLGHLPEFLPTRHGFDDYFGLPYSNDMWPKHPNNEHFNFPELPLIEEEEVIRYLNDNQDSLTTWYTQRSVKFIEENKDRPFLLYLAHSMPHVPLYVSDRFRGKSGAGLYGDVIMEMDWSAGQIMAALEKNGIAENTLVIFTSDNGPWLSYGTHSGTAGPLREGKGTTFEGGIRVPFIARWPAKIPQGMVQKQPASTIDLFPTIAGWIGAPLPRKKIDGKDISPLLLMNKNARNPHEAYFFYYRRNELQAMLSGDGRWKLYFPHKYRSLEGRQGRDDGLPIPYNYDMATGMELYDLQNDIGETTDVSDKYPEQLQALQALAARMRQELGDQRLNMEGEENRPLGER